jgi:hypothetical protein
MNAKFCDLCSDPNPIIQWKRQTVKSWSEVYEVYLELCERCNDELIGKAQKTNLEIKKFLDEFQLGIRLV